MKFRRVQPLNQILTIYQVFCAFFTDIMEGSRPSNRTQPPARWVAPVMRADPFKRNTYGDGDGDGESHGSGGS